jgi:glycine/D-amino acid oxidase-like deaminating enzyme
VTALDMPAPGPARSFWLQEALAADPGEPCPALGARVKADVCIVGGGFAGLWTALRLTERAPGIRIALLEQDIVGGGASGRNGGFFSTSWHDLDALCGLFGDEEGLRYATVLADAVGQAGDFVATHGIDCWFHHDGVLGVRSGAWQPEDGFGRMGAAARLGVADRVRALTSEEVRGYVDSPRFLDGAFDAGNAICHPARLARGLRRLLLARGVRIYERTPMTDLERSRPAVVRTPSGAVKADHVVLTIGAWAAGWRPFTRSFGVISDYVVATEPIPDRLAEIGWTRQFGIADGREWLYYLRPTDDGRIVIGGGAGGAVFGGAADGRGVTHDRRLAEAPARGLLWMFPPLEGIRFTHAWGGPIDQTPTFEPFYRTLRPGNVHAGLGYSGHGLAQTFVGGHILASTVLGVDDEWTALAVNRPEIGKTPPEPLRYPLVSAAAKALARGDARQDAGRARGLLYGLVGDAPIRWRERLVRRGPVRFRSCRDRRGEPRSRSSGGSGR